MRRRTIGRDVEAYVCAHEGLAAADIAAALGIQKQQAVSALANLSRTDRVRRDGWARGARWYGPAAPPGAIVEETATTANGVPSLVPRLGERRECAHYEGCLDRFVRTYRHAAGGSARCPAGCASHAPITRERLLRETASSRHAAPVIW